MPPSACTERLSRAPVFLPPSFVHIVCSRSYYVPPTYPLRCYPFDPSSDPCLILEILMGLIGLYVKCPLMRHPQQLSLLGFIL